MLDGLLSCFFSCFLSGFIFSGFLSFFLAFFFSGFLLYFVFFVVFLAFLFTSSPDSFLLFLSRNTDLMTSRDAKGFTPLHWAACFGHEAVLELLLENEKLRDSWSNDISALINGETADEGWLIEDQFDELCPAGDFV